MDKEVIPHAQELEHSDTYPAHMISRHGTETQKQHFLPRMATGEVRGSFSMSEPDLGSDVAAIKTKAKKTDDGESSTARRCG